MEDFPSRGWILGKFQSLVGLQGIWDSDKKNYLKVFGQLVVTT